MKYSKMEKGILALVEHRGLSWDFRKKLPDILRCYLAEMPKENTAEALNLGPRSIERIFTRFERVIEEQRWDLEKYRRDEVHRLDFYKRIYLDLLSQHKAKKK